MDDKGIVGSGWDLNPLQWKVVVAAQVEKNEMTVRSEHIYSFPIKSAQAPIYQTVPNFSLDIYNCNLHSAAPFRHFPF